MERIKDGLGVLYGVFAGGFALGGLIILADLIGAHAIGYGKQTVEIVSIEYTGHRRSPYRLNYRGANGDLDAMTWPKFLDGADDCKPGMVIDAVVSLTVGTPDVDTCRFEGEDSSTL